MLGKKWYTSREAPVAFTFTTRVQEGFVENICIVKVTGRIVLGDESRNFREYVEGKVSEGFRFFILDCSDVTFIDSTGLGVLAAVFVRIKMRAGQMVLIGSPDIREKLQITKFSAVFDVATDIGKAIEHFKGHQVEAPPEIKYEEKFSVAVEENKGQKKVVVSDNFSGQRSRSEYPVREIPEKKTPIVVSPKALLSVVVVAVLTLASVMLGLILAARAVASTALLVVIFGLALLFLILLTAVVLLLSGHLSEKTASKLFGGVLGKIPGLAPWTKKGD